MRGPAQAWRLLCVQVFTKQIDASLTWEFVAWLRTVTRLPIYVKVGANVSSCVSGTAF